jgi:hypothetical protein
MIAPARALAAPTHTDKYLGSGCGWMSRSCISRSYRLKFFVISAMPQSIGIAPAHLVEAAPLTTRYSNPSRLSNIRSRQQHVAGFYSAKSVDSTTEKLQQYSKAARSSTAQILELTPEFTSS